MYLEIRDGLKQDAENFCLRSSGRLTGNPHLARHWLIGRVTEGLPTNRPVHYKAPYSGLNERYPCSQQLNEEGHFSEKPTVRPGGLFSEGRPHSRTRKGRPTDLSQSAKPSSLDVAPGLGVCILCEYGNFSFIRGTATERDTAV